MQRLIERVKVMESLEYAHGDFVFRLQGNANGYNSHMQIYTKRHYDNALQNGSAPWAFMEIKVKSDNGEFAFDPENSQFEEFCKMWISDPVTTQRMTRDEIQRIENASRCQWCNKPKANPNGMCGNCHRFPNNSRIVQLNDFPYIGFRQN